MIHLLIEIPNVITEEIKNRGNEQDKIKRKREEAERKRKKKRVRKI